MAVKKIACCVMMFMVPMVGFANQEPLKRKECFFYDDNIGREEDINNMCLSYCTKTLILDPGEAKDDYVCNEYCYTKARYFCRDPEEPKFESKPDRQHETGITTIAEVIANEQDNVYIECLFNKWEGDLDSPASKIESINCSGKEVKSILDLKSFSNLKVLHMVHTKLAELDVKGMPNLSKIYVSGSELKNVPRGLESICERHNDAIIYLNNNNFTTEAEEKLHKLKKNCPNLEF